MPRASSRKRPDTRGGWVQNRYKHRDRGFDLNLLRLIKAYYYASISLVDFQIGRVLQALDQAQVLDNTLILFTSDHGEHLGDFGCFGKRSMHDASVRVPMVVRFPARFPDGTELEDFQISSENELAPF